MESLIPTKKLRLKTYASAIKNIAANDPLITTGDTLVVSKKRDIGIPPKVPKPFIIPDKLPAKIFVGKLLILLFEYPLNCKITKKITIPQIERCVILGDKNFNK